MSREAAVYAVGMSDGMVLGWGNPGAYGYVDYNYDKSVVAMPEYAWTAIVSLASLVIGGGSKSLFDRYWRNRRADRLQQERHHREDQEFLNEQYQRSLTEAREEASVQRRRVAKLDEMVSTLHTTRAEALAKIIYLEADNARLLGKLQKYEEEQKPCPTDSCASL